MRRKFLTFIGAMLLAGAVIGPLVHASATVDDATLETETRQQGATARVANIPPSNSGQSGAVSDGAQTTPQVRSGYVALGDSVAAGAGLSGEATGASQDRVCDRSSQAYPYLIAERLQTQVVHAACSGAKVDEGIYDNQSRQGTRLPPQMDAAFASGVPEIMTITIGANDVRWTQFIRQCYVTRCGLAVDDARMKVYRADLRIELTRMFTEIQSNSSGNPPQVFMSGYYQPVASTECFASNRIAAEEATWLTRQTANLNQAIRSVIPLFPFVEFVPIDFTGHEICSADPWVQGVEAEAPLHPTAAGQSAIAESFISTMGR